MSATPKARLCPFCGERRKLSLTEVLSIGPNNRPLPLRYTIRCRTCLAQGPHKYSEPEAVAAWNGDRRKEVGL